MIESLSVENYRSFESYRIDRLATVNLLVGRNNCGKTSLLESIEFLASRDPIVSLIRAAFRRNEVAAAYDDDVHVPLESLPLMTHFFHGHVTRHESSFILEGGAAVRIRVSISWFKDKHHGRPVAVLHRGSSQQLQVYVNQEVSPFAEVMLFPDDSVAERDVVHFARRRSSVSAPTDAPNVEFITTNSLDDATMVYLWNQIIRSSQEQQIVDALKLIDDSICSVQFLSDAAGGTTAFLVDLTESDFDSKRRVPLGTLGEGTKRLLALAMALARTADGILLVDEIDTGLHYSVLSDMWQLVIETAIRNNVQVFATTHSLDCLRGLDAFCRDRPDLGSEVLVHKLDRSLDFAVTLDAADFHLAIDQELEVR